MDRVVVGGLPMLVVPNLREAGVLVAFTERTGGASGGSFRSLNLGLRSGDDIDAVRENRRRVTAALGIRTFACGRQVHGGTVVAVERDRADAGFMDPGLAFEATDALVAVEPGVAVAVITADCVPVALVDAGAGLAAAVHAGWRGLAAGVVGATVARFPDPSRIRAVIGPAVGPDHYPVGSEVIEALGTSLGPGSVVHTAIDDPPAADGGAGPVPEGRSRLDLERTIEATLRSLRVEQVTSSGLCTACHPDRFFSHRRDGVTGRQGLVVARL